MSRKIRNRNHPHRFGFFEAPYPGRNRGGGYGQRFCYLLVSRPAVSAKNIDDPIVEFVGSSGCVVGALRYFHRSCQATQGYTNIVDIVSQRNA
jgi:hypothetical protein